MRNFDPISDDEYVDHTFTVTISVKQSDGAGPTEDEIRTAIYRHVEIVDSEDAIIVTATGEEHDR